MQDTATFLWPWAGNPWLSAVALVLFGVETLLRRLPEGRMFLERVRWPVALANVVIAPLAVGGLGHLLHELAALVGPPRAAASVRTGAAFVVCLVLAAAIGRVAEVWLLSRRARRASALQQLERTLLYGVALFVGILAFLLLEGRSPTELFVSTSVVAAIVAFGLQQTLGDLFSGVALSLERPFRPGDWLALADGTEGEVRDTNWRATRLRGWDNATHVVPNSVLARQGFRNLHGAGHVFAPWYHVRLPAEVDPRIAKALLLDAALRCGRVMSDPLPVIRLSDATTIPYLYMVWVHFQDYQAMFAGREELFREIHYALRRAGIQAAPTVEEIHHRRAGPVTVESPSARIALKALDIASGLVDDEIDRIAAMSRQEGHDAGTVLLREDAVTDAISVVIGGVVEASVVLEDGGRRSIERLLPGDYFGLTSMLTCEPAGLEFRAATDVTVLHVDIACLRSVLADRADLAGAFAAIVRRRMQSAEEARRAANRPVRPVGVQDLIRRIETSLGFRRATPAAPEAADGRLARQIRPDPEPKLGPR